jgi:alkanesulfonate monooxygenase SsuD/methylene tetrahydromethanopterin reductase-like flavin-dependent oxidoreductase (luciferase family)
VDEGQAAVRRPLRRFADILFAPKPVQKPCPALWVGGESGPAMRRAARLGDGWYPIGVNP